MVSLVGAYAASTEEDCGVVALRNLGVPPVALVTAQAELRSVEVKLHREISAPVCCGPLASVGANTPMHGL